MFLHIFVCSRCFGILGCKAVWTCFGGTYCLHIQSWRLSHYAPAKLWYTPASPQGVTTQNPNTFFTMRIPNLIFFSLVYSYTDRGRAVGWSPYKEVYRVPKCLVVWVSLFILNNLRPGDQRLIDSCTWRSCINWFGLKPSSTMGNSRWPMAQPGL